MGRDTLLLHLLMLDSRTLERRMASGYLGAASFAGGVFGGTEQGAIGRQQRDGAERSGHRQRGCGRWLLQRTAPHCEPDQAREGAESAAESSPPER